jgi:hypothetical protein
MSIEAFAAPGRFYRGNLHTHSTESDGKLSPEEVCQRYRENGYDFICLSDHFSATYKYAVTDTTAYRTPTFTTLLGAECHAPSTAGGDQWHILAVGLPPDFLQNPSGETGVQLAQRCLDTGALVALVHPEWYGLTAEDAATIPGAHAIEIYNHTSQVHQARGGGAYYLDILLNGGRRINALAGDDSHWDDEQPNRDAFGGWIMVKAQRNEPAALLEALKQGSYYSTQGPTIENIAVEGEFLNVKCSPADQVMLVGRGARNEVVAGPDRTSASIEYRRFANDWCRVMVMARDGKIAWSNPLYLQLP